MTTEEKFSAAVNVIRNLPKNGAYQPSHDLKLRFYAYFKQATDGPCSIPKPAFWDIIGRSKYDAWKKLGNMSKKEAMENYVEELKKIVETMSYNDNVGMFLGSLGNFYDHVPVEDIEMLLGPVIERMRSQPGSPLHNSPLGSRETSPTRIPRHLVNKSNISSLETSPLSSMSPSPQPPDTDDEDEEFIDTVETTPHASRKVFKTPVESPPSRTPEATEKPPADKTTPKLNGHIPNGPSRATLHNGNPTTQLNGKVTNEESEEDDDGFARTKPRDKDSPNVARRRVAKANGVAKAVGNAYVTDLSEPLREAVLHLQKDLDRITARVRSLEVAMLSQPQCFHEVALCKDCDEKLEAEIGAFEESISVAVRQPVGDFPSPLKRESFFRDFSPSMLIFIVVWPFFAHFLIKFLQARKFKNCQTSVKYFVRNNEMFDALYDTHLSVGHGGSRSTLPELHKTYNRVMQKVTELFVSLVRSHQNKWGRGRLPAKEPPITPPGHIVDVRPRRDSPREFVMASQLRSLVQLRALEEAVRTVMGISCVVGAPAVLLSDRGREFASRVAKGLGGRWVRSKMIAGRRGGGRKGEEEIGKTMRTWMGEKERTELKLKRRGREGKKGMV